MEKTIKMRILLTGDKGFIAKKLKERLVGLGHQVIGYDIVDGLNLLDLKTLEEYVQKVDVVYHVAAQADLNTMYDIERARSGVLANVEATHNIAYLCSKYSKWLIYVSTVCVYGNQEIHPETEDTTLPNPSDLYACSKYAGEWIVKGYSKNFGNPFTILRFATIYGEGMRSALGIHIFLTQALTGRDITVHGDGKQDRTQTYIEDLIDGCVAVFDYPENAKGQVFNLTNSESISATRMAEDIKRLTKSSSKIVYVPQRDNQTFHEDFDVSKAEKLLHWTAKTSFEDGLIKTMEWVKELIALTMNM